MTPKLPPAITDQVIEKLILDLGLKTSVAKDYLLLSLENALLFDGKQQDYGPANIAEFGLYGVVVRMNDKFKRIVNLFNSGRRRRTVNESIRDTFRDVHVYANIALLIEQGKWPNI